LSGESNQILEMLLEFSKKYLNLIGKMGLLDAKKLLNKGLMIIKRDEKDNKVIVPLSRSMCISDDEVVLKEGQIT